MDWFTVDKQGLAKILEKRGKAFAIYELIANAWDTKAKRVDVALAPIAGKSKVVLTVSDDDPDGFANLEHAFTLFAESEKKGDATKRGRFNLGEKLVLALCDVARIKSTTGSVYFDRKGRHRQSARTEAGSEFYGHLRMTRGELADVLLALSTILPPASCQTSINGELLPNRAPVHTFEATLPTEIGDADGILRRSERRTEVRVFEARPNEIPSLYELGIPVVETGDRWHVDVAQKVPLNMDRDNVPPFYLRHLRTAVVNEMHSRLTVADANSAWVREATSNPDCSAAAITKAIELRFTDKRVIFDMSDPEANKLAASKEYTVIHGSMLNKAEWDNLHRAGAALPAGKVTPSPKPYSSDGEPLKLLAPEKWTAGIQRTVAHCERLARELLDTRIVVQIAADLGLNAAATFGPSGVLVLNLSRLGHAWFDDVGSDAQHELIIHEFGHHYSGDHLSSGYHEALCTLGARAVRLALARPDLFLRKGK